MRERAQVAADQSDCVRVMTTVVAGEWGKFHA